MTDVTQSGKKIFYGWWLVAILMLIMSVGAGASLYLYSVVAESLEKSYPSGRFIVMMGATGLLLTSAVMSPKVGALLDRFPVKNVVIAGALVMGMGFILIALSSSIWQVIICYGLFVGAGLATLSPLTTFTLLSRWFVRRRGLAVGIASLGTQLGGLIFPPLFVYYSELFGWRLAIGGLGVFVILVVPILAVFTIIDWPEAIGLNPDGVDLPKSTEATGDAVKISGSEVVLGSLFTQRNFLLLVFVVGGSSAVNVGTVTNLSLFATDIGESVEHGAYLVSLVALIGMISSPLVGHFCDIWSLRLVSTVMYLLSAVAAFVFVRADSFSLLLLATVLQGFTGGCVFPIWASLVGRIYGTHHYGQVMGASTLVIFSMTAMGPMFAGWVHDLTGSYRWLFLVMFALMIVITICLWLMSFPQMDEREASLSRTIGSEPPVQQ